MKKKCSIYVALGVLLSFSVGVKAQSWGTTSDVLSVGLAAIAVATPISKNDNEGVSQIGWTLGVTVLASELLKATTQETRPDGSGNDSFPSNHAAVSFAAARFLQKRYGNEINPIALYGAASLSAVARVEANKHYWSDVLFSAALGYATANYFTDVRFVQGLSVIPSKNGLNVSWNQAW